MKKVKYLHVEIIADTLYVYRDNLKRKAKLLTTDVIDRECRIDEKHVCFNIETLGDCQNA